ncbi:carbonic anhydrase [Pirellulaceae bacterium SH501]
MFSRSAEGQKPLAVMLTCSDSRVLPETLLRLDPGELFVIRNAGNMISANASDSGELASIEYAVKVLGVEDIVVCGHYRCGAVMALISDSSTTDFSYIPNWLAHGKPILERLAATDATSLSTPERRSDLAVELNVLQQTEQLGEIPFIKQRLDSGSLRLHAWVLRFEKSELLSYDPHSKQFKHLDIDVNSHPFSCDGDSCGQKLDENHAGVGLERLPSTVDSQGPPTSTPSEPQSAYSKFVRSLETVQTDILASFVLFCISLPFCIAISRASNVSVAAGITAALVASWLVGAISRNRILVSGPSTSLIAIVASCVTQHGVPALACSVVVAGLFQILFGAIRIGRLFRATSPALVQGLMAGIGASLLVQQFHLVVDETPLSISWRNLLDLPMAAINIFVEHGHEGHRPAAMVGLLAVLSMFAWDRWKSSKLRWIPSILIGILIAAAVRYLFSLPIEMVKVDTAIIANVDFAIVPMNPSFWVTAIVPTALAIAIAASSESLLALFTLSPSEKSSKTQPNRELIAQGIGNLVSGGLGGLPISIAMVRSQANRDLGAKTFLSVALHGVWFLVFVGLMPFAVSKIPSAALAAILLLTGYRMIGVRRNMQLFRDHRDEAIVFLITAVGVFSAGILPGMLLGIIASILLLLRVFSRMRIRVVQGKGGDVADIIIEGNANYFRMPKLLDALESVVDKPRVRFDVSSLSYLDHACLSVLESWTAQRLEAGKQTEIDLMTLRLRFQRRIPRPRSLSPT